ncbi:40S ribosomal protein S9 [Spraguea lophii 42_110]|uniref:40S ribosomal protein S9 n=1 Tax=Spraguea lophii (strain 42_110) TaxID=1358809 RepID=S7W8E3_SPRLO|nr:Chain SJ0, 40S ribosomal protein S9 [Spraguea lophii 42_110]7QJH_RJ0 Chain RJ0, 40S ribosomal protein S9 [Spraguea lophii 42_110]7QJH_SJ0 Chain SJ0, 40S ribosomal protein S9 [Spraguea lophii 42_110]8BR3_SJ0 Chain SJ0, 40S ribosomal protein S9 [Spraguea lophii 42_110]8P5D_SJ0 Chain SJ0, 40S ribosomal protein S9 [Spraguea lophii 42_110]8P60_RJ0 Chain RJ0, 40S ribosomal protein S9 [Spraguea lophii 42_110]8P60_SJ0 Chain SJ0, 40S ribosomal protein S9 [Spraguea lophii 42_110]EPR79135.1 40S ribo
MKFFSTLMVKSKGIKKIVVPHRPFERERLVSEMYIVGKYGLRNKRELWTIQKMCDSFKLRAKDLLITPDEKEFTLSSRRLLKKLAEWGVFMEDVDYNNKQSLTNNLEKLLDLAPTSFLERRLQHRIFDLGLASSVHQARAFIHARRVKINGSVVNKPGYLVKDGEDGFIEVVESKRSALVAAEE